MAIMWYKTWDGRWVNNNEVTNMFETLNRKTRVDDEGAYIKFLDKLFEGKMLVEYHSSTDFPNDSIAELAISGRKIAAARVLRDKFDVGLREALDCVDAMVNYAENPIFKLSRYDYKGIFAKAYAEFCEA